jgi:putative hydroxymethylpyrimidine transport system substrate-binding protein
MRPHQAGRVGARPRIYTQWVAIVLAGTALALGIVACGDDDEETGATAEPQRIELALDFYVNPDHAGVFAAIEKGYFEQEGLDVRPRVPSDPSAPIKQVAAGRADLAISYEPEVLLAKDQGLDVVAVAAIVDSPLTSLISVSKAGIESAADLDGKTIATAGIPYQSDYLETILATAGLSPSDVDEVNVGFSLLPAVIGGRADAMLGGFRNVEGVDLRLRGLNPRVVPVDELGVPTYDELVLVAKGSSVEKDPDRIRGFISALAEGTAYAVSHPQEASNFILDAGRGLDPTLTRAEMDATLPLLEPQPGKPYGFMDDAEWSAFAEWMAEEELLAEGTPEPGDLLTNELLTPAP